VRLDRQIEQLLTKDNVLFAIRRNRRKAHDAEHRLGDRY
jgi:hypothetical protein